MSEVLYQYQYTPSQMEFILQELRRPFHPSRITWKPGSVKKDKTAALALAYADLRAYQDRLDEVCGMNWAVEYIPWGDKIIARVIINGIARSSTGEPTQEAERGEIEGTVAEAQAFKRACAMWGLGRYLYEFPSMWVDFSAETGRFTDAAKSRLAGIVNQHYQRYTDNHPLMVDGNGNTLLSQQNGPGTHASSAASKHTTNNAETNRGPVQPATEDVDFYPPPEDNPFNDPPQSAPVAPVSGGVNPKKLNVLNALGTTFYNARKNDDAWDKKREELCKSFGLTSSTQLNNEQCDKLIVGLEKRIREVVEASDVFQPGELTVVVQECTAYGDRDGVQSLAEAKGVGLAKVLQEVKRRKIREVA